MSYVFELMVIAMRLSKHWYNVGVGSLFFHLQFG